MVDPHHALRGGCFPVVDRPSSRGPGLIVVRLPDGRERAIPRTATDLASPAEALPALASAQPHVSVRTLLPLANHVRAVLASRNAGPETEPTRDCAAGTHSGGVARSNRRATPVVGPAPGREPPPAGPTDCPNPATASAALCIIGGEPSWSAARDIIRPAFRRLGQHRVEFGADHDCERAGVEPQQHNRDAAQRPIEPPE